MEKFNLKVNPQKTEITTLTPTSLDNIKTKKLGTYLSMDKEISHRKALTLVAMNKLWILYHKNKISQNKKLRMFNAYIILYKYSLFHFLNIFILTFQRHFYVLINNIQQFFP